MKIIFTSQFRDSSGYASAARSYLEAIDSVIDKYNYDFKILSISLETNSKISSKHEELITKYEISLGDIDKYIAEDYLLIWHQPTGMILFGDQSLSKDVKWVAFRKLLDNATKNINMTVWESDSVPDLWTSIHRRYKTLSTIVPCAWNQEIFSKKGIRSHLLPHVITDNIVDPVEIKNFPINLDDRFVIFSMSQWIQRKGFDALVRAYSMEFNNQNDTLLVVKTYINAMKLGNINFSEQSKIIHKSIIDIKSGIYKAGKQASAPIVPICNILPYENISWLYDKSDVFALATRGEGFGLTISEAIMHEKPVVVPDYGGHMEYLEKDNPLLFKGHLHPYVGDPTYDYDMNWYEPDIIDLRKKLRHSYNLWKENKEKLTAIGKQAKEHITKSGFDLHSIGHKFFDIIKEETKSSFNTPKQAISSLSLNKDKIMYLKDLHKGEDCYILTCGPSLGNYSKEFLKEKLKDKTVLAVKQAYNYTPEVVDYHFFNANNFQVYEYSDPKPVVITNSAESELACAHSIWTSDQEYDIFTFIKDDKDFQKSICKALNFDDWTFDKTLLRPWGPGMMTEVVIFFAIHLGFKNIYTIGWDLEKEGETKSHHFYKDTDLIRRADVMKPNETKLNIEMTKHLHKWLKSKGINLFVASEDSYVHNTIPRRLLK